MTRILLFLMATSRLALCLTVLPEGQFEGEGIVWDSSGIKHPYQVRMQFDGNSYLEEWSSEKKNGKLNVSILFEKDGRIRMDIAESSNGPLFGYCGNSLCHIEGLATNGSKYEQTYLFGDSYIRKLGSESKGNHVVMWESLLNKVK